MSLVTDSLSDRGVAFAVVAHRRAFTSLQEARELGVAADEVLKTVAVRTQGRSLLGVPMLVAPEVLSHQTVLFAAGLATESVQVGIGELLADQPTTIQRLTGRDRRAREEPSFR